MSIKPLTVAGLSIDEVNDRLAYLQTVKVVDWPGSLPDARITYASQKPHVFFGGPASGTGSAVPTWRALAAGDVPDVALSSNVALKNANNVFSVNQTFSGIFSTYSGLATAGLGVATVLASVGLTAQSANIAVTNLLAAAPAGLYRATFYLAITTVGTGNVTLTIAWNDGTAQSSAYSVAASGLSVATAVTVIRSAAAQNITYSVGGTAGGVVYSLFIALERLS